MKANMWGIVIYLAASIGAANSGELRDNDSQTGFAEVEVSDYDIDSSLVESLKNRAQEMETLVTLRKAIEKAKRNSEIPVNFTEEGLDQEIDKSETTKRKGQLYVFVSSSMPMATLREYARMLEKTKAGTLVMNGFIGGMTKAKPTMAWIKKVLQKDSQCAAIDCEIRKVALDINPILFSKYNINKVPSFVWDSNPPASFCEEDGRFDINANHTIVQGASDIFYALEEISRREGDPEINQILEEHYRL